MCVPIECVVPPTQVFTQTLEKQTGLTGEVGQTPQRSLLYAIDRLDR